MREIREPSELKKMSVRELNSLSAELRDEIIKVAYDIVREIEENEKFDDSEKLLVIDLIVAKINYDLFRNNKKKSE